MPFRPSGSPMPAVGSMCPMLPGTTVGGWAVSGLPGFCAVPAGGVAAAAAGAFWVDEPAWASAAAGVSPAAAKAIAHPISLIDTPAVPGTGHADAHPDLGRSIGAGFAALKRVLQVVIRADVDGACPTA